MVDIYRAKTNWSVNTVKLANMYYADGLNAYTNMINVTLDDYDADDDDSVNIALSYIIANQAA